MSLSAQAKVLRVIQEQKIERIGGERTIDTDVRIIAATNQDLEKACKEGRFRQDLFFRLNVIPIHVPSLRERKEDIPILLYHFLNEFKKELVLDPAALDELSAHTWPGNVRELKNLAERIAVMHPGNMINSCELQKLLGKMDKKPINPDKTASLPGLPESFQDWKFTEQSFNEARENFEKKYLEFHLLRNNGIISKTAEAIGMYPSNLHAKLRKYNINPN